MALLSKRAYISQVNSLNWQSCPDVFSAVFGAPKDRCGSVSFYRYYLGRCSAQLAAVIPHGAIFGRHTRQANKAHPYAVKLDTPRTSLHQSSFFYMTALRWNSLPASIFPRGYDLQAFKRGINRHLSGAHIAPRVT